MRLDRAFGRVAGSLEPRERAFARELAYGTVRLQGRLDHLLAPHVHRGLEGLHPSVSAVLRSGLYQLLYLDVPDYAAVSQAVEQARGLGKGRAAGLVNAVLRAAGRAGESRDAFPDFETDPVGFLSTWGSHPRWLVERWSSRWPAEEVRTLVELDNQVPELFFVPVSAGLDEAAEALLGGEAGGGGGVEVELLELPGVLRIRGLDPGEALARVPGFIQDPAAALVCRYAAPPPGALVADLCAAPGGKALSLARRARYVLAADSSGPRLAPLRENVERLGLSVGVVHARAESPPLVEGSAPGIHPDLTLLDVPCTGTGTLRRHPDARWRLRPSAPAELAQVQRRILGRAAVVVPKNGVLVYSTCTLEPEENGEVVREFLDSRPDFEPAPPTDEALNMDDEGWLEILPQNTRFDGAFAARMRRVSVS